jgi:3-phenylpropionate/cinnamic acid dioxygenase small subunit
MALSLQQLSDRIEIDDLLIRYTRAIDDKDWDVLDTVFAPDAAIDYTSSGGVAGKLPEVKAWLAKALAAFPETIHYVTNSTVELDGDRAKAKTAVYNPMFFANPDGSRHHFAVGAYYVDELVRTADGWRIASRREDQVFLEGNLPGQLEIPNS